MRYLSVAYDDFDRLSDDLGSIKCPVPPKLPSWEVLKSFKGSDIRYLIGFFVFLIEHQEKGIGPDEKARLKHINKMIRENVAFSEDEGGMPGCVCINEKDYRRIFRALESYAASTEASLALEEAQDCLKQWTGCCFALGLWLLIANKDKEGSAAYQGIKGILAGAYQLKADQDSFSLSEEEYGGLKDEMEGFKYPHTQWWPTQEEVKEAIAPNIGICYDFVLWLLTGYRPRGEQADETARMLERLLTENIRTEKGEDLVWS